MALALTTPVINGNHFSYASVEFDVAGLIFADVIAIDYADPVKPGKIFGTGGVLIGRTPGTSKPTLSITVTRRVWDALRAQLSDGKETYGLTPFIVRATYFEPKLQGADAIPEQLISDIIEEVRVIGPSTKNAPGTAATAVVLECDPVKIKWGKNEIREGSTALEDDGPGSTVSINQPRPGSADVPGGSATWWASNDDGFWAAGDGIHAPGSFDTFTAAGIQFPGKCTMTCSRPPARAIEEQKPNGSDYSAMIDRGFIQATFEIDVLLWMRAHLAEWEGTLRSLWVSPGKAGHFEEPIPQTAPSPTSTPQQVQAAQVARANVPIKREIAAITAGRSAVARHAMEISHPALALLGITTAILESPGILIAGPEPQTMIAKTRWRQYLPASAGVKNPTGKFKGVAPKEATNDPRQPVSPPSPATTETGP